MRGWETGACARSRRFGPRRISTLRCACRASQLPHLRPRGARAPPRPLAPSARRPTAPGPRCIATRGERLGVQTRALETRIWAIDRALLSRERLPCSFPFQAMASRAGQTGAAPLLEARVNDLAAVRDFAAVVEPLLAPSGSITSLISERLSEQRFAERLATCDLDPVLRPGAALVVLRYAGGGGGGEGREAGGGEKRGDVGAATVRSLAPGGEREAFPDAGWGRPGGRSGALTCNRLPRTREASGSAPGLDDADAESEGALDGRGETELSARPPRERALVRLARGRERFVP